MANETKAPVQAHRATAPLQDKNGTPFLPITSYNQIVMPNGDRWDGSDGTDGTIIPKGGKVGDVLAKRSNEDHLLKWTTPSTDAKTLNGVAASEYLQKTEAGNTYLGKNDKAKSAENADKLGGKTAADFRSSSWMPTAKDVGALGASEKAVDSDKLDGETISEVKRGQNLLDNWYFADPINQRGKNSYIAEHNGEYSIDRWYIQRAGDSVTLGDGYADLEVKTINSGSLRQIIPILFKTDMEVTLSILCVDGYQPKHSAVYIQMTESPYNTRLTVDKSAYIKGFASVTGKLLANTKYRMCVGDTCRVVAIKLEFGDHQTLAHQDASGAWVLNDPPPNRAVELTKCQRYYYQSWDGWWESGEDRDAGAVIRNTISGWMGEEESYGVSMAGIPTITFYSTKSKSIGCVRDFEKNVDILASPIHASTQSFRPFSKDGGFKNVNSIVFQYSASCDL